jgi:hypothetical protein
VDSAEADFAVSVRPPKPYQHISPSLQKNNIQHKTIFEKYGFRDVKETSEAVSMTPQNPV